MDKGLLANLEGTSEFKLAEEIARELKNNFGIDIPDDEKGYIAMHLLGAKLRLNARADEFFMISHNGAVEAARRILVLAGEKLKTDLMKDDKILEGLAVHLKPAISRLKLGMEIRNPLISQLKNEYPEIMRVAQSLE
ncbi:MAG: mannitol operon transcriptional activator [Tepidanaerobacteraceae bacterium]|nr:mannitol operon transcriptional activator [Tepidanaerobacteraceae bacterium]